MVVRTRILIMINTWEEPQGVHRLADNSEAHPRGVTMVVTWVTTNTGVTKATTGATTTTNLREGTTPHQHKEGTTHPRLEASTSPLNSSTTMLPHKELLPKDSSLLIKGSNSTTRPHLTSTMPPALYNNTVLPPHRSFHHPSCQEYQLLLYRLHMVQHQSNSTTTPHPSREATRPLPQ